MGGGGPGRPHPTSTAVRVCPLPRSGGGASERAGTERCNLAPDPSTLPWYSNWAPRPGPGPWSSGTGALCQGLGLHDALFCFSRDFLPPPPPRPSLYLFIYFGYSLLLHWALTQRRPSGPGHSFRAGATFPSPFANSPGEQKQCQLSGASRLPTRSATPRLTPLLALFACRLPSKLASGRIDGRCGEIESDMGERGEGRKSEAFGWDEPTDSKAHRRASFRRQYWTWRQDITHAQTDRHTNTRRRPPNPTLWLVRPACPNAG